MFNVECFPSNNQLVTLRFLPRLKFDESRYLPQNHNMKFTGILSVLFAVVSAAVGQTSTNAPAGRTMSLQDCIQAALAQRLADRLARPRLSAHRRAALLLGQGRCKAGGHAPPRGEARFDAARAAVADYRARLAALYRYNLLTQNCVSEIFATIDAALGDTAGTASDPDAVAAESRRRLGGVVRTGPNLNFIPVVSAGAVARTYTAVARRTRPSYRQLRLGALAAEEPWWRVALRESNTLTSTVYHPGPRDSAFLFFTDDAGPLRPVLGAANLLVALADGILGLATWPVDDGTRLRAGLRGALFSLPELTFVNLRKGSMAYVDAATRSPPATTAAGFEPTLASK